MTPKPMSDERIAEIEAHRGNADEAMLSGCTDYACYCHFNLPELIAEIRRLKAAQVVPPDVLAAMERYRSHLSAMERRCLSESPYAVLLQKTSWVLTESEIERDQAIIARHFTSHHGKDGA